MLALRSKMERLIRGSSSRLFRPRLLFPVGATRDLDMKPIGCASCERVVKHDAAG